MAFIGDSDPLEDNDAEEGSLYQTGEAQKGDPQKGGTQYYASPIPGITKQTDEAAGEHQFMSILQSLNDSVKDMRLSNDRLSQTVKGLAGESRKKQAGEQTQTQALERFGETVLKQMDQRLDSINFPRGGYRGRAPRGRGRWKNRGGGRGDGPNPSRDEVSKGETADQSRPLKPQSIPRVYIFVTMAEI